MIGRYPDFDVLETADSWDDATRKVVLARLDQPGPLRFFTAPEEPCLRAFCDTVLAQDTEPRVPVAESVDSKLADGRLDGYQYADMPDDRDTWRLVLRALDETASDRYGKASFAAAEPDIREAIIGQFSQGRLDGGTWDASQRQARLVGLHAGDFVGLLLPPVGLERDRIRRSCLPTRIHAPRWCHRAGRGARTVRVSRRHRRRPGPCGRGRRDLMGDFWRGLLKGSVGPPDNDSRYLLDVHSRDLPGEKTMRRYRDEDEVDLVVVGAGAGGSVLAQRLARAGWRIVMLEAGPFWHPDQDWVSDEAGSHALYWTQKRILGGDDPIELGKNNSGRGVGGSMVHYAGYTPRFHPMRLRDVHPRRRRSGLAHRLRGHPSPLRAHRTRVAGGRTELALGLPTPLLLCPTPDFGSGRQTLARGPSGSASRCGSDRSESSTVRSATGRTASTAATACRAARSTRRPARMSPTCPMRWPTTWRYAPTAWLPASNSMKPAARAESSTTTRRRRERLQRAEAVAVAGYSIETPAPAAELGQRALPKRVGQQRRSGRTLCDGAGRQPVRRPVVRRSADVQSTAAGGLLRAILRNRRLPWLRARVLRPDCVAAADRMGRTCSCRRSLGCARCASTCATTTTGRLSAC